MWITWFINCHDWLCASYGYCHHFLLGWWHCFYFAFSIRLCQVINCANLSWLYYFLMMTLCSFILLCSLGFALSFLMESAGYHILMPRKHYVFQDSFVLDNEKLGRLFQIHSVDFSLAFHKVLGKWWIVDNTGCFVADIASRFLIVCMDVLLDSVMVRAIFDTYFSSHFYTTIYLDNTLSNSHFEFGDLNMLVLFLILSYYLPVGMGNSFQF